MKTTKRLTLLSLMFAAIIVFWLMPGINTARDTTYTRIYEDTDALAMAKPEGDPVRPKKKNTKEARKKKYKSESISSNAKLSKIKPEMFSRAIQFRERKVMIDTAFASKKPADSTLVKQ